MSFPPTVITTDTHKHKHEQEQDTCSHHGVGSLHAATLPRAGTGHVAQLCQDRDDARRGRDGRPDALYVAPKIHWLTKSK